MLSTSRLPPRTLCVTSSHSLRHLPPLSPYTLLTPPFFRLPHPRLSIFQPLLSRPTRVSSPLILHFSIGKTGYAFCLLPTLLLLLLLLTLQYRPYTSRRVGQEHGIEIRQVKAAHATHHTSYVHSSTVIRPLITRHTSTHHTSYVHSSHVIRHTPPQSQSDVSFCRCRWRCFSTVYSGQAMTSELLQLMQNKPTSGSKQLVNSTAHCRTFSKHISAVT